MLFFLCNIFSLFSYVGGVLISNLSSMLLIDDMYAFGFSANYNTRGPFTIPFLICSDLLNCPRSDDTIVITTEMAKTASKLFSPSNSSQKPPFFAVLMYSLYDHPRYFKFNRKHKQYCTRFKTIFRFLMITFLGKIRGSRSVPVQLFLYYFILLK